MPEKKTKRKIPVIRIILLCLILYVAVRFVIGDGREYDYVEDTAVHGTQEGNSIYEQNVLMGENGSLYVVYYSDRHTEVYKGNLEAKEHIKQNGLELYDMNVIGNTVYALEGTSGDGFRVVSFNLDSPEKVTRIIEKANSEGKQAMHLSNLLVVEDTCYFLCEGDDSLDNDDNVFISYNLITGEEKIIDVPPIREYFIDNGTVYFIGDDDIKLYSMPLDGGEITCLSPFKTDDAFMYEGRIYYEGQLTMFTHVLMSMNPDGTNHKMHQLVDWDYYTTAFVDGKLYTYNGDSISCMDIDDGVSIAWEIDVREQVISKITSYYAEYIDTSIAKEEITTRASVLRVSNGYAYFIPECVIGETSIREAFIMDLNTKEIYLLNEYLGVGPEVEYKEVIK